MALDILNNEGIDPPCSRTVAAGRSPCLVCPHRDMDKNKCSMLCLRLAAYNSGEPWEGKPLPYIAKGNQASFSASPVREEIVKMEETEVGSRKSEVGDQKKREYHKTTVQPGSIKQARGFLNKKADGVCLIDGCDIKDRLIRGLCPKHYQAWRKGRIKHPILGEFTVWQAKSQIKPAHVKKTPELARRQSGGIKKPDSMIKTIREVYADNDIEMPAAGLIIDLDKFQKIKSAIYDTAEKYFVTPEHVVIGLLGEALAGRNQRSGVRGQPSEGK